MRRPVHFAVALAALLCMAQAAPRTAAPPLSPQQIYGPLFEAVQGQRIFPDGKTFVDAVPKDDPAVIVEAYRQARPQGQALRDFVLRHFSVPGSQAPQAQGLRDHIRALWPHLTRPALEPPAGSSALALPAPYVVPGGRFREIYYWDSYFTMLGLQADGQQHLIDSMLVDFESLVARYGFIPNGTRTYYLGRSQPPFLALMVDLASQPDDPRHLAALRAEHAFWMRGSEQAAGSGAALRVARMPDGALLNRYWDDRPGPRDESWAEDVATARDSNRDKAEVYRHLRAGAESGWDFSSRWLKDPRRLSTIRTTDIVPVDLNSLLWRLETSIAGRCAAAGDQACARRFDSLAQARKAAIDRWLWQPTAGRYADWDRRTQKATGILSAATLFPLFVGLADQRQADAVARLTEAQLLGQGGLRTSLIASGQQWDSPNGWAPLQWVAIDGLARTGHAALAREIARRWIGTVTAAFRETGKMLEKYDVEQRKPGGGGEYPLQDGFGWTNGVTAALLDRWPDLDPDAPVAPAR
ncbi:MAG: alpha,alpha-trehalase TreF [Pseudomonadota bacterium]|nr:alpha,alpha-trehalase TreF [Sphingobium naphthae]MEC7934017.1 alpha,alpha-trehalase TreF [Pseudomonadota bacterium]MEC8036665.1 alpha,alpha-trehalase TreF [Pseudomonadota bacterium]